MEALLPLLDSEDETTVEYAVNMLLGDRRAYDTYLRLLEEDGPHKDALEDIVDILKSDADFVMNYDGHNAHTNWTSSNGITCNDTTYDSAVWQDVQAPFVYLNGSLYYIDFVTGDLCRFVGAHQKGEALMRIEDRWYAANGAGYYPGIYSSLAAADGKLYFTTSKTVGCFDPKTNTRTNDLVVIGSGSIVGILRSGELLQQCPCMLHRIFRQQPAQWFRYQCILFPLL